MTVTSILVALYLAAMLLIGFRASRGETAEGFLIGERKLMLLMPMLADHYIFQFQQSKEDV